MVTPVKKTAEPKKDMSLPVAADVRALAEEAMILGDYGTLTNTLRVSLRETVNRLKLIKSGRGLAPTST